MMRAALIVLSYNHVLDTVECLQSIYRNKPAMADVIIVDNASTGDTVAELLRAFPDVEIIELKENKGWAGGNNVGIQVALKRGYNLICLMNNDLVFCADAVRELLSFASNLPPCLLHPSIYYYDNSDKAQMDPSIQNASPLERDHLYALDFAYGACLTIHAEIFDAIGLMDERFFLQLEETDFYLRAVEAGFRSLCYTNVRVLHKESVSLGGRHSPTKTYYTVRNSLLLAEKHAGSIAGYVTGLRRFIWTLWGLAGSGASPARFLRWFCSHDGRAMAARAGIRDYALRRFGCMGDATMRALSQGDVRAKEDLPMPNV